MNDSPAIIWGMRVINRERLEQYISSVIKHLKGRGIEAKDRLVIVDTNSIEYVIILLEFVAVFIIIFTNSTGSLLL